MTFVWATVSECVFSEMFGDEDPQRAVCIDIVMTTYRFQTADPPNR